MTMRRRSRRGSGVLSTSARHIRCVVRACGVVYGHSCLVQYLYHFVIMDFSFLFLKYFAFLMQYQYMTSPFTILQFGRLLIAYNSC